MASKEVVSKICVICESAPGKYKCPSCMKYTCSLTCNREHKERHANEETGSSVADSRSSFNANGSRAEDGISGDARFSVTMEESSSETAVTSGDHQAVQEPNELQALFNKYPDLPYQLLLIAEATDPPPSPNPAENGRDNRGGKKKQQQKKPWTKEIGLQNASIALNMALEDDETGAVKEYYDLVLVQRARKAAEEADAVFRKQIAQRDAQRIAQLIREERQRD